MSEYVAVRSGKLRLKGASGVKGRKKKGKRKRDEAGELSSADASGRIRHGELTRLMPLNRYEKGYRTTGGHGLASLLSFRQMAAGCLPGGGQ